MSPPFTTSVGKPILVFGGTGHYGRNIVRSLLESGVRVRVLSRNAPRARSVLGNEPEVIEGDITSRPTVISALDQTRAIIIAVSAFTWKTIRRRTEIERDSVLWILKEADRRGIVRVVCLSGYDVRKDFAEKLGVLAMARPMLDVQAALAESRLNWTVLGCPPSMEIFFAMIRGARMIVPGGGPPALPSISPVDVGTIAAQAVLRDDLGGQRIRLPGPEALSFPEAARRISAVWGREIHFHRIPVTPLKIASVLTRPFNPFLVHLVMAIRMLNNFPGEFAAEVPRDHQLLREAFDFTPTSLEVEARRRMGEVQ
ncbi:MAG: NAD(P)H-binding protein [Candidatus Latescibacteria bacterium]|nr:NAD(P)H-binding protein [Candidatus Latescibacterota bacterium]NIO56236.1 NAD(P)H-binding protein [Candidatus Latescibacterota bacterium]